MDDPVELKISQELEEFLKDLTLEFPFPEIFEVLRRHELKDRFGAKIRALPSKRLPESKLKEIDDRVSEYLKELKATYGPNYHGRIEELFKSYTQTTVEE